MLFQVAKQLPVKKYCCSVTSCIYLWPHWLQHARLPCPSLSLRVCSNSSPLSQWCHPTISFSVTPFSSCPQSFPVSGSFPMSRLFTSGGQSIGTSPSVLPMNIQDWFLLGLTGLISFLFKVFSRVLSITKVWKHQFFDLQQQLILFQEGKGVHQGCILSTCLFNLYAEYIMRNAGLEEAQAGIKISWEISITSDMQMTPPLWRKVKRN